MYWLISGFLAFGIYCAWRAWPFMCALAPLRRIKQMKQALAAAKKCYANGEMKRAADLAGMGLSLAGSPQDPSNCEKQRIGSKLAVVASQAFFRLNQFQLAELMAHKAVLRDGANPFAHEALGLALSRCWKMDGARASFALGLKIARESKPANSAAEKRMSQQLVWLGEYESTLAAA